MARCVAAYCSAGALACKVGAFAGEGACATSKHEAVRTFLRSVQYYAGVGLGLTKRLARIVMPTIDSGALSSRYNKTELIERYIVDDIQNENAQSPSPRPLVSFLSID